MTTLSANTLSPVIISPSDLRKLLTEVERDLIGHLKLELPTSYDGKNIWTYYKVLGIVRMVYWDALFVMTPAPLIDKSQWLMVYKIHSLTILMPPLLKQFKYNLPNNFIAIWKDNLYITYPNSEEIFSCQLSVGYHCEINTPFYPLDSTNYCSYYLLQNYLNKIEQYCSFSVIDQTTDETISLYYYYWAITTMVPTKLQVMFLTSSYYIKLKCWVDIIFLTNACEAYTNTFYLSARNSLS